MASRRVMRSVVRCFLDSFRSRNTDHRGYWLLGQLPREPAELRFDLLAPTPAPAADGPIAAASALATRRFATLLHKAGLSLDVVQSASLEITRLPEVALGWRGESVVEGQQLHVLVSVSLINGRRHQHDCRLFVAPHDSAEERRRMERDWGLRE